MRGHLTPFQSISLPQPPVTSLWSAGINLYQNKWVFVKIQHLSVISGRGRNTSEASAVAPIGDTNPHYPPFSRCLTGIQVLYISLGMGDKHLHTSLLQPSPRWMRLLGRSIKAAL